MTVSAELKACVAKDWTLIASGAAAALGFVIKAQAEGRLLPTASNSKPADYSDTTPAFPVVWNRDNNFASDTSTYWWFWNPSDNAVNLIVWKL